MYAAVPSQTEPNSWNVILVGHRNERGGQWVEVPHVTREEAVAEAARLNALLKTAVA